MSWYQVITTTDVGLPQEKVPGPPPQPVAQPANPLSTPPPQVIRGATYTLAPLDTDYVTLPYMPDPLGVGAAFLGLPGVPAGHAFIEPNWGKAHWPYQGTFRLLLKGIDATAAPNLPLWETSPHPLLTVELPQGDIVTVQYSSRPNPAGLLLFAMWDWIVQAGLGGLLLKAAEEGLVWLLTPSHEMTLVHAVQRPLIKPAFSHRLMAVRQTGETSATLFDLPMPISGHSTVKLDLLAHWYEPTDDVTQPGPSVLENNAHVSEIPMNYADTALVFPYDNPTVVDTDDKFLTQEFSNTRYHRVAYTMVGTTRYREYFPFSKADLAAQPDLITRASDTGAVTKPDPTYAKAASVVDDMHRLPLGVIDVPSSARPQSPNLLYVVPIFAHETMAAAGGIGTLRRGGGLRVYLERPWYSSGEGELLGVVLPPVQPKTNPLSILAIGYKAPDPSHLTQWGVDPLWLSRNAPTPIAPTPDLFTSAVRQGNGLSIDEQPGTAVAVAGHEVTYDPDRRLWYADVILSGGLAYFPFIRLVLARYQPNSILDAHLSRLVLADFAQIAPDRAVTVVFNSKDSRQMQISVFGQAPLRTTNRVEVSLEQQLYAGPQADPDLGWIPVDKGTTVLPSTTVKDATLWRAEYTLPPLPTPLPPLRLVVREYEIFPANPGTPLAELAVAAPLQERLVYAEVLDVLIP